ncbi:MAG: hypothetical protein OQK66_06470 [Prosthecochloris sp.]|uniref:hypothetical protein n=1 Tax=unclassified Prosthecochloris TaxID=2632826 RepID=UPI000DF82638|nr:MULTISPECIES: hypothetical protein [unclassified Prosthecochloris]MCW8798595.1 hypothetical protein [Prosthecochloris sp.]RDD31229.1 hypothetical protein CR161_11270 [Prosthecochloris sp. ZM]
MIDDVIRKVEAAIDASEHWQERGWPAVFGPRNVEVPNMKAAEELPKNAVYREEALNYWRQAELLGIDTAQAGRKALDALKDGRLDDADNALYLCQYLEKPFEGHAGTWIPLYESYRSSRNANH